MIRNRQGLICVLKVNLVEDLTTADECFVAVVDARLETGHTAQPRRGYVQHIVACQGFLDEQDGVCHCHRAVELAWDRTKVSGTMQHENRPQAYLDLDLTLPPRLVAVRAIAPALYEIACASATSKLDIGGDRSLFSNSEICTRFWRRRCSSEGVCFPLGERTINRLL